MATQATARLVARETKLKQQAARVLQELYDVALDETVPIHSRLHAMKLFLNKTMPDLKAIEYKADIHEEQVTAIEVHFIEPGDPRQSQYVEPVVPKLAHSA